ncbi:unnamed protein product [Coccothraustes coccothraustes]
MSSQRRPAKAQLRRSLSEQLRDSTAKAWDLLWRNVRERRLAGQSPPRRGRRYLPAAARGDAPGSVPAPAARRGPAPGAWPRDTISAAGAARPRGFGPGGTGSSRQERGGQRADGSGCGQEPGQAGRSPSPCRQHLPGCRRAARGCSHTVGLPAKPPRRSVSEAPSERLRNEKRVGFASGKQAHLLL